MTIEAKKATLKQVADLMRLIADGVISGAEIQEFISRERWTPVKYQRLARKYLRQARKLAKEKRDAPESFPESWAVIARATNDNQDLFFVQERIAKMTYEDNKFYAFLRLFAISGVNYDLMAAEEIAERLRHADYECETTSHHLVEIWANLYEASRQEKHLNVARKLAQKTKGCYVDGPLAWLSIAQVSRNVEDCNKAWDAASSIDNHNALSDAEVLLAGIYLEKEYFEAAWDTAKGASEDSDPDWPDIFLCNITEETVCSHLEKNNLMDARKTILRLERETESEKQGYWFFVECQIACWQKIASKSKDASDINYVLKAINDKKIIINVDNYLGFIKVLLECNETSCARKLAQNAALYVDKSSSATASAMAFAELGAYSGNEKDFENARTFISNINDGRDKTKSLIQIGRLSGNLTDLADAKRELLAAKEKGGVVTSDLREELFHAYIHLEDYHAAHKEAAEMSDHDKIESLIELYKCLTEKALAT